MRSQPSDIFTSISSRAIDLVKALGLYNEGLEDKRK